ncbi:MAG: side tail fiber protein, partial [Rhizobium sp.]|nr:side tail fiber protein [Rhizobium sp.]
EASLREHASGLLVTLKAQDEGALSSLKGLFASQLVALSQDKPTIVWTGDGTDACVFPNFREMTVRKIIDVTPHMRRITLAGHDLARFAIGGMHLQLLIPPDGLEKPEWPTPGPDGLPIWPSKEKRPRIRTYTVRRVDLAASTFDVDFVVHGDHGGSVGSRWAADAKPGAIIGVRGPVGRAAPDADWVLLAGDETALPVISRILETLPASTRGVALIEVEDAGEEQRLDYAANIELHWLHRGKAEPGQSNVLVDAVRSIRPPAGAGKIYAMAGTEYTAARAIRAYWRDELKLDRKAMSAAAYWRLGRAEDAPPVAEPD